jgi:hypothetical protein
LINSRAHMALLRTRQMPRRLQALYIAKFASLFKQALRLPN